MRIIIADDEYYARKAILKMIKEWDSYVQVVADVENGKEVIELMKTSSVDVVLTDIRMPNIDGLELCRYINENYPSVIKVIISGYSDFQYAREAIISKAEEYLLKPIDERDFFSLLERLKTKVEKRIKMLEQEEKIQKEFKVIEQNNYLRKIFQGNIKLNCDIAELFRLKEKPNAFYLCILQTKDNIEIDMNNIVSELIKKNFDGAISTSGFNGFRNEFIIICFYFSEREKQEEKFYRNICIKLKFLTDKILQISGKVISAAVSNIHSEGYELAEAYREVKYALNYRLISGWGHVFEYKSLNKDSEFYSFNSYQEENSIIKNIECGKFKIVKDSIKELFENSLKNEAFTVDNLEIIFWRILAIFKQMLLQKNKIELRNILQYSMDNISIHNFSTIDDITIYLNDYVDAIANSWEKHNNKNDEAIVTEIKKYINKYYYCEISLNELSLCKYFYHPSYLSKLFKHITGLSFSRYLLKVRMENAKELVDKGNFKIYEVSNMVGYNSTSYFVKIFKQYYGITPGERKK